MEKHKHAEVIKAWADGATIQMKHDDNSWHDSPDPTWLNGCKYRIKPERVYPETRMTSGELSFVDDPHAGTNNYRRSVDPRISFLIANAAIKHALDAGQVMLPGGELADKDIIDALKCEEQKQDCHLSNRAYEVILPAIKSLLVDEPEIEKLKADRSARDMAIAEAVRHVCMTLARDMSTKHCVYITIKDELQLDAIIATVK